MSMLEGLVDLGDGFEDVGLGVADGFGPDLGDGFPVGAAGADIDECRPAILGSTFALSGGQFDSLGGQVKHKQRP